MATRNFPVVYFVDVCIEHAVERDVVQRNLETMRKVHNLQVCARQVSASVERTNEIQRNKRSQTNEDDTSGKRHILPSVLFGELAVRCRTALQSAYFIFVSFRPGSAGKQTKQHVSTYC